MQGGGEMKIFDFATMKNICDEINALRQNLPEIAKELDDCLFAVMKNHTPKCGHGTCSCQTMTAEEFHRERNIQFGTTSEAKSYEFN